MGEPEDNAHCASDADWALYELLNETIVDGSDPMRPSLGALIQHGAEEAGGVPEIWEHDYTDDEMNVLPSSPSVKWVVSAARQIARVVLEAERGVRPDD
jgi:hypothetical protein